MIIKSPHYCGFAARDQRTVSGLCVPHTSAWLPVKLLNKAESVERERKYREPAIIRCLSAIIKWLSIPRGVFKPL